METSSYEHTQPGTLLRYVFSAAILILGGGFLAVGTATEDQSALSVSALSVMILLIVLVLFHSLTVKVTQEHVRLSFGIGLIKKRFAVADIQRCNVVQNRWFYGWGIRLTPRGWLYNASGWDAVELEFQNGRKTRVGTDDAHGLQAAIQSMITAA